MYAPRTGTPPPAAVEQKGPRRSCLPHGPRACRARASTASLCRRCRVVACDMPLRRSGPSPAVLRRRRQRCCRLCCAGARGHARTARRVLGVWSGDGRWLCDLCPRSPRLHFLQIQIVLDFVEAGRDHRCPHPAWQPPSQGLPLCCILDGLNLKARVLDSSIWLLQAQFLHLERLCPARLAPPAYGVGRAACPLAAVHRPLMLVEPLVQVDGLALPLSCRCSSGRPTAPSTSEAGVRSLPRRGWPHLAQPLAVLHVGDDEAAKLPEIHLFAHVLQLRRRQVAVLAVATGIGHGQGVRHLQPERRQAGDHLLPELCSMRERERRHRDEGGDRTADEDKRVDVDATSDRKPLLMG